MSKVKIAAMSLMTLAILVSGLVVAAPASAQRYTRHDYGNFSRRILRTEMNRPAIRIMPDRDYFNRRNLFFRHPEFRGMFPSQIFSRRIIFIDRDNLMSRIDIDNFLTGPFSVNSTNITMDHDSFLRLRNQMDIDNNIDVSVNTGNNTVSFNTVVGNVTTGDVNIDIR